MKRAAKWAGVALVGVVLVVAGLVGFVQVTWSVDHPDTPFPDVRASSDPEVIARGEYLVHAVSHCSACHTPYENVEARILDTSAPLIGGYVIEAGPFGTFPVANITPDATGIGGMSDGELARVIRHGIDRDGKLAPMMRFAVGSMSDEDLAAVISWLRAQEPVAAERAPTKYGILAKALSRRFTPNPGDTPPFVPEGGISVERGRYLAAGPAFCSGCHSPLDPMAGFAPAGPPFSGAAAPDPDPKNKGWEIMAPNLTPHAGTGRITGWTEDQFVARFRAGRSIHSSPMPWEGYRLMTEDDLRSVYRFLMSLDPVEHDTGPSYRQKGSFKR
jgi:mono/diheme cytochrome c family protein